MNSLNSLCLGYGKKVFLFTLNKLITGAKLEIITNPITPKLSSQCYVYHLEVSTCLTVYQCNFNFNLWCH